MKLLKEYQLNLDTKHNLKIVDHLDILFDLNTGIYKTFNKPKNKPLYIIANSHYCKFTISTETDSQICIKKDYR